MRKLMAASLLGLVLVVFSAAPALALRDPFDPVIDTSPEAPAGGGGAQVGDTDGGAGDGPTVIGQTGGESLANTGAETEPWLVMAYAAIAIGAGAVVVSKVATQHT
ncbi:MAG TPA: hypothetical protein VJ927_08890 [Actinomycetota bacterium]|nr:hypothetical protein [Actinomycetota bacterium]